MSYNSTTWQTGDIVTANKLNNIEQGITTLETALNGYSSTVATTSANGLMSSTDKQHLDTVYTDYTAMLALI